MDVQINSLSVVLAAVGSMLVGSVWYAKPVFGKTWSKLTGLNEKKQKQGAAQSMIVAFVAALLTAYVLAHITFLANRFFSLSYENWMTDALQVAFWLWVGISATTVITHNAFEQKPVRLTAIAVGHQFVSFMVMGAVIGLIKPLV